MYRNLYNKIALYCMTKGHRGQGSSESIPRWILNHMNNKTNDAILKYKPKLDNKIKILE